MNKELRDELLVEIAKQYKSYQRQIDENRDAPQTMNIIQTEILNDILAELRGFGLGEPDE